MLILLLLCSFIMLRCIKKRKQRSKEKEAYNAADLRARNASVDNTMVYGHGISTFVDGNANLRVASVSASPVGSPSGSPRSGVSRFTFDETNVDLVEMADIDRNRDR